MSWERRYLERGPKTLAGKIDSVFELEMAAKTSRLHYELVISKRWQDFEVLIEARGWSGLETLGL
jgi:hypothetical protein